MPFLDGHELFHLRETPMDDQDRPRLPAQLFAALTAAHAQLAAMPAEGRPGFVVAWDRPPGQRQIRVLAGGRPTFPPGGDTSGMRILGERAGRDPDRGDRLEPVLYPPGSRATVIDPATVHDQWSQLPYWTRCHGQPDHLWADDNRQDVSGRQVRGGFDDYIAHLPGAFAWLVVATPRTSTQLQNDLDRLEVTIPGLRLEESVEASRIDLVRAEGRFRELSKARAAGTWDVHVLVGAQTEAATRSAAALLCSASDLDELPYVLTPGQEIADLESAWTTVTSPTRGALSDPASPFTATSEFLTAIARPPRRELPGIRLVEQPRFDLTPEHDGDIPLGWVLDDADLPVGDLKIALGTLNRHAFVAGATGSGKSQTVRHLLQGLHQHDVPWLVIEPAKSEYAGMAGRLHTPGGEGKSGTEDTSRDDVFVIRPGDPDAAPVGLNPLEPEPGFPLQTHLDLTRALFMAAFDAQEPFPQVLSQALATCYSELGWDPVTGDAHTAAGRPKYPDLADLQRVAMDVVDGIGYGPEISQNVRGFIDVRIGSLRLGTPGRFFEAAIPIDVGELLRRNVVLEIEDIGNDADKAFFIGTILIRLYEHLRVRDEQRTHHGDSTARGLAHVTVLEEAHRLLKRAEEGSPTAHAVELFTSLLAEIRAYGEGIIVAEQIPAKIVPDVIKNTALKILHRLPAADDRETVGATMNLDDAQSRHVVALHPGRAVIFTDGMDRPIRLTIPLGETVEDRTLARQFPHTDTLVGPLSFPGGTRRECTLRELNRATRLADDHPELMLWIELLVLAHVTGQAAPSPRAPWLQDLTQHFEDTRLLERGVAHRIEASIETRYTGLAVYYRPEDLAEHLMTSVAATLTGEETNGCDGSEVQWQAGPYRWNDIFTSLHVATVSEPHPDTIRWEARGVTLPGSTASEQLTALRRHPSTWQPDHTIITGGKTPVVDSVIARLSNAPDHYERFLAATSFLSFDAKRTFNTLELSAAALMSAR
ncbi:ATP-binding protein [Promicromonospora vindobonensis]|uniref:ATP-binding protein n=1 Tax=Promicromonospora vindobonensis TaxID=195748 RepID=A0ABW5VUH5_9MICO